MIRLDRRRTVHELLPRVSRLFELSATKILAVEKTWRPEEGAPVFTVNGRYRSRGWTESRARSLSWPSHSTGCARRAV